MNQLQAEDFQETISDDLRQHTVGNHYILDTCVTQTLTMVLISERELKLSNKMILDSRQKPTRLVTSEANQRWI